MGRFSEPAGHAKDVRSQVSENFLATPKGLAVYDPLLGPDVRIHEREQVGLLQVIAELCSQEH